VNSFEDDVYSKPFSFKVWAGIFPFFKPFKKQLVMLTAFMAVGAVFDTGYPLMQKYVIDNFIVPGRSEGLWLPAAIVFLAFLAMSLGTVFFIRIAFEIEMKFSRDLKKALFNHLQTLSLSYYNTTPVGYMIARVMSDTGRIGGLVAWGVTDVVWGFLNAVFVLVAVTALNIQLGLIMLAMAPVMAIVTWWFQNRILRHNRQVRRMNSRITGSFNEGILGARTSKTLVIEDINSREFSELAGEMYRGSVKAATLSAIYQPVILMFGAIAIAAVLVRGSGLVSVGGMALGTFSALCSYAIALFEPIRHITRIFAEIVATQANIERVLGMLEKEPEIQDSPEVVEKYGDNFNPKRKNWEDIKGDIEFKDVTFKYPDGEENVLEHFDLKIPAGACVAIVGETGAGKSTLVNLVCRFFEPTQGQVLIDGRDSRERSQLWLHSNIGYVLQSPHLFSGSIAENIRYGKPDATDEEIAEAARLVSADKIIAKLPNGIDSDVGEGGDKLSTGEKQLISFARAVIADPRIFVLDEATSSIDTETERLIQHALTNILTGRTSFLIAHRLSTIKMADLILVVKNGKIIERGTHRELLRKKGYYLRLYTMQFEDEVQI
jgi:ATP-binding cassette subfamily B protein